MSTNLKPAPAGAAERVPVRDLYLWLRRCRRRFREGVAVIEVNHAGKLLPRRLVIGRDPECVSLQSSGNVTSAFHYTELTAIRKGRDAAPQFKLMDRNTPLPAHARSLCVETKDGHLALVFESSSLCNDALFLLRTERRGVVDRHDEIKTLFLANLTDNSVMSPNVRATRRRSSLSAQ